MSRPITRAKNVNQHPGQVILETKQKRRTTEQKQANNLQALQVQQEKVAAREQGINCLANIMTQSEQDEHDLLNNSPKPRLKPRVVTRHPINPSETSEPGMDDEEEVSRNNHPDEDADKNTEGNENENEVPAQASRKQCTQKTSTRSAVKAAQCGDDNWLEAIDKEGQSQQTSVDGQPGKRKQPASRQTAKEDIAGIGNIQDWLKKTGTVKWQPLLSHQRSSTPSSHARSASSLSTFPRSNISTTSRKVPRPTPVSISSGDPSHPSSPLRDDLAEESEPQDDGDPYIQGSDQVERQALILENSSITCQTNTMDVTEVVTTSEPDERATPPPSTQPQARIRKNVEDSKKRPQIYIEDSQSIAVSSKRAKMVRPPASKRLGSGAKNKYVKDDLPVGCTTDNVWRRLFISTLAHFASGYDNPWSISTDKLVSVLQEIWDVVYGRKIEHMVTINGPVFHLAKQSLNAWRSGFAAAASAILTSFFATEEEFKDAASRIEFAMAMLNRNRFLFGENLGENSKEWSGLWRSPFMLQTFAHHFNYIQGRVDVTALEGELNGPRAALALACAAVCRVLTLVTENTMTFKIDDMNNWTPVVPKGAPYEFNDSVWGMTTRHYLEPISKLSDDNMAIIIEETQPYMKSASPSAAGGSAEISKDSKYENLFAFR